MAKARVVQMCEGMHGSVLVNMLPWFGKCMGNVLWFPSAYDSTSSEE